MKKTFIVLFSVISIFLIALPVNADENAVWSKVDNLNNELRAYKRSASSASLKKLFQQGLELSENKNLETEFEQLRTEAYKTNNFKKINAQIKRVKPAIRVIMDENDSRGEPDISFFLALSPASSVDHKFFTLAAKGYRWHDYCHGGEAGQLSWMEQATNLGKDLKTNVYEKLLAEWEALTPELNGIYSKIAKETTAYLKKASAASDTNTEAEERLVFEYELDAYYTSAAVIYSLTDKPIPHVGKQSEFEVYKNLFQSSYLPRFVLLEASVNPMPCLGVFLKRNYESFYDDADVGDNFNVIESITAGFDEPYALSFFMGDVVSFSKQGEESCAGNKGFMGYLVSIGDRHIKDNELIDDNWYELEWKIKGDREYSTQKLNWSFRIGTKIHDNPEITDVYYISLKRSRVDYKASASSWLKNSGIEYTFDMDKDTFNAVQNSLYLEKKWPLKKHKFAFTLTVGFIWEANQKYTGSLQDEEEENFQVAIWPNLQF